MTPSYKTTGAEREGVSGGYFELDPASIPRKIEEFSDPENIEVDGRNNGEELAPASVSDGRALIALVSDGIVTTINFDCPASIAMHSAPVKGEYVELPSSILFVRTSERSGSTTVVNHSFAVTNDAAPFVAPNETSTAIKIHTSNVSNDDLVSVGNYPDPLQVSFGII
ncbi:hypothetical protein IFM89_035567 [Coptis chinensis]|uniref:Uncharacterized protein n=1 Tax=Coptis chinensis TaxID=261450 RepID=A0A835HZ02_9MAGN|nr:hypothetical protein IFM89_035567 [Coptis chinensis]